MKLARTLGVAVLLGLSKAGAQDSLELLSPALRETVQQAQAAFECDRCASAASLYERVRASAPGNVFVLSNLGVVRLRLGQFDRAADVLQQAILLAPDDALVHCTLGVVRYRQARCDEAIWELRRAIELDPRNAGAHEFLGLIYARQGDTSRAQAERNRARELDPAHELQAR